MIQIIAETAFSHQGDLQYLKNQIELAKKGNADFIKFQVFINKEEYFVSTHNGLKDIGGFMFSKKEWTQMFEYANELDIKVIALPLNVETMKFCLEYDDLISMYEIHSVCFNELELLLEIKKTNKKIILGIGGRLPEEIAYVKDILNKNDSEIILIYGFQSFPTDKSQLNLNKLRNLKLVFNNQIGYADHTTFKNNEFNYLNSLAYLQGAIYFEKHIVIKKGKQRIDYETAIDYKDFLQMRKELNKLELILGDGNIFKLNAKETNYKNREKQIVSKIEIKRGELFSLENLCFKITNEKSDFNQTELNSIIGKKAAKDILKDAVIKFGQII